MRKYKNVIQILNIVSSYSVLHLKSQQCNYCQVCGYGGMWSDSTIMFQILQLYFNLTMTHTSTYHLWAEPLPGLNTVDNAGWLALQAH